MGWNGMGMEWNQNWNGPSAVIKQVQVGEVPLPLVQQSTALVLGIGNRLKLLEWQDDKKV